MENLTTPQKVFLGILGLIVIIIIIVYVFTKENSTTYGFVGEETNEIIESQDEEETNNVIIIHVAGEVLNEGIVEISSNSRISDAINAAGGLTEEADISKINLASPLKDGEKVYIPNSEELKSGSYIEIKETEDITSYRETGKVNINTATQTELETLSGIGPSTALKIINYRKQNGKFKSIEDIKNVSGIGEAKFNSIKDSISIN